MSNISKKQQQWPERDGRDFSDYTQLSLKLQAILSGGYQGTVIRVQLAETKPLASVG
jgi:hypothetical protein